MADINEKVEEQMVTEAPTTAPVQERHPFRPASLVLGLLALLIAALVLLDDVGLTDFGLSEVDAGGAAAILLIGAGVAWLFRAVSRLRHPNDGSTDGPG